MKINVYQMQVDVHNNGLIIPVSERKANFVIIGSVVGDCIDVENVWHLTNHSCWNGEEKIIESDGCVYIPTEFDKGYTNDDICFNLNGVWYCAKDAGWHITTSLYEAKKYLMNNSCIVNNRLRKY